MGFKEGRSQGAGPHERAEGLAAQVSRALALSVVVGAATMVLPGAASAQSEGWPTDSTALAHRGMMPLEVAQRFRCSEPSQPRPNYCIRIKVYGGEIKIGKLNAKLEEPIEMTVPASASGAVEVPEGGDGGGATDFEPIKISGGITGVPALDPVIDNEPLGILTLTATPVLGSVDGGIDGSGGGGPAQHISRITLPISIKLNNRLFGDDCFIGTPEDPIVINLSTSRGQFPYAGYEWWTGSSVVLQGSSGLLRHLDATLVDDTFAVPGATKCGPLPRTLHDALDEPVEDLDELLGDGALDLSNILGESGGLANPLINAMAGLPSPSGSNRMSLKMDTAWAAAPMQALAQAVRGEINLNFPDGPLGEHKYDVDTPHLDFGRVAVGQVSTVKTVKLKNLRSATINPALSGSRFTTEAASGDQFELVSTTCTAPLAQNQECELSFRFRPTAAGNKTAVYKRQTTGTPGTTSDRGIRLSMFGIGSEPAAPPQSDPAPAQPTCKLVKINLGLAGVKTICL